MYGPLAETCSMSISIFLREGFGSGAFRGGCLSASSVAGALAAGAGSAAGPGTAVD
jgi:hypothetical protein